MPTLRAFLPCEKVIIGQGDNSVSLISLLQDMTVTAAQAPPVDALGPYRWSVFTLWHALVSDGTDTFEQKFTVVRPDGQVAIEAIAEFSMTKPTHRLTGTLEVFPIGTPGECNLFLYLRNKSKDENWGEPLATFPLLVIHAAQVSS